MSIVITLRCIIYFGTSMVYKMNLIPNPMTVVYRSGVFPGVSPDYLLVAYTYADGSTITYTYTPDNLPLRTTYASGKWKENVYDVQRRLSGVIYSSPDMDYELQLDDYGNATNVQAAAGNLWRYEYGFNSQLLSEEYITTGGTRSCASASTNGLSRSYDSFDRPTGYALTVNDDPKGNINYAYDDDNRISHIIATNSAGRSFTVVYTNNAGYNYGYTITTPSGNTIRRIVARDDYRRNLVTNCATYFNSSLVDSNTYAFDALSRPTARTTSRTGCQPVQSAFAYNNRSEVISAAIGTNLFTHTYDDIGNQTLFGDNAETNTFSHNQLNQLVGRVVLNAPPTAFAYTPDGGLASDGTWSYAYDAEDQLTSVISSSLTNDATRVLNSYDYRHRRTAKTVQRLYSTIAPPPSPPIGIEEWQTIETRTFVYDDWNLIHETIYIIDGGTTNTTDIQYFWGLDLSGTLQGAGGVGGLLAVSRNGQLYFPTFDNNGNVTKYIDESGNMVAAYEYDDFGRTISQSGPLADFFRHRFSTKYYDPESELYYNDYRFYHTLFRRWLNRDIIEEDGGLNLYVFVANRTLDSIDAFGNLATIILAGDKGDGEAFTQVTKEMNAALNENRLISKFIHKFSPHTYECLQKKNMVRFNGVLFTGSIDEYRKKIDRELKSSIKECAKYSESLQSLSDNVGLATEAYDYVVYAAHGVEGWNDKSATIVWFSDGLKSQKDLRTTVMGKMSKSNGIKIFLSCYQSWNGKGKRPPESREFMNVSPPRLKSRGELDYIPMVIRHGKVGK